MDKFQGVWDIVWGENYTPPPTDPARSLPAGRYGRIVTANRASNIEFVPNASQITNQNLALQQRDGR